MAAVERVRFFSGEVRSRSKLHVTVGHATGLACSETNRRDADMPAGNASGDMLCACRDPYAFAASYHAREGGQRPEGLEQLQA